MHRNCFFSIVLNYRPLSSLFQIHVATAPSRESLRAPARSLICWLLVALLSLSLLTACGSSSSTPLPAQQDDQQDNALESARWIGFRDGDGEWEQIDIPSDYILDLSGEVSDADGRYTLLIMVSDAERQKVAMLSLQSTLNELARIDLSNLFDADVQGSLTVTVSNVGTEEEIRLFMKEGEASMVGSDSDRTFTVDPGTYDLIVTVADYSVASYPPTQLVARRDLAIVAGTQSISIDLDATGADAPITLTGPYTITADMTGLAATAHIDSAGVSLRTANGTSAALGYTTDESATGVAYHALPLTDLAADDVYLARFSIDVDGDAVEDEDQLITYFKAYDASGDDTVSLPATFDGSYTLDTGSGVLLPGISATAYSNALGYTIQYGGISNGIEYTATSHISSGWFDSGTIDATIPDPQAASGWKSPWSIPVEAEYEWITVSAQAGSTNVTFEQLFKWYFGESPDIDAGQWLASVAHSFYNSDELLRSR